MKDLVSGVTGSVQKLTTKLPVPKTKTPLDGVVNGLASLDHVGVAEPERDVVREALGPSHDVEPVGVAEHGASEFAVVHGVLLNSRCQHRRTA